MNRTDFENWMKDKLSDESYRPTGDMWTKLKQDLEPARSKRQFLVPVFKIAALLVLTCSVSIYYLAKKEHVQHVQPTLSANTNLLPATREPIKTTALIQPSIQRSLNKQPVIKSSLSARFPGNTPVIPATPEFPENQDVKTIVPVPEKKSVIAGSGQQFPVTSPAILPYNGYDHAGTRNTGTNFGIAANIGKPGVGTVGYQLGIVGRTELSGKLYLEATLAMASTSVSYAQQHTFRDVSMGSDGFSNSFEETTTNINAHYARNIIAVGIHPAIGFKISPKLSISGGGAVFRNLNPLLSLTNEQEMDAKVLEQDIISRAQQVNNWDIGLTGAADYKINRQLSVNLNYRKGLTDYLLRNSGYERNSGVQVGLKYLLAK